MNFNRREILIGAGLGLAGQAMAKTSGKPSKNVKPDVFQWRNWEKVRAEFRLDRSRIQLAGLLLASHPRMVREAIEEHRRRLDESPAEYYHEVAEKLETEARAQAAAYLEVSAEEIALTDSTTMGLALVYTGLKLGPGDEVLSTIHDHYSTNHSLDYLSERTGTPIKRIALYRDLAKVTEGEIIQSLITGIGDRTRVIAVTWVHSSTGLKLPIAKIAAELKAVNQKRGEGKRILLCVDGVHGFGIENVTLPELGCDFFIAGCHKWLFGPRGTGFVWGSAQGWEMIRPTIPTFSFAAIKAPGGRMTPGGFHSFEHRWALGKAFEFHLAIGKARIAERIHELNRRFKEGLADAKGITLHTPLADSLSAGIICFEVKGVTTDEVVKKLAARRIVASATPYQPSYPRVTPGLLNTFQEVDRAVAAVRALGATSITPS